MNWISHWRKIGIKVKQILKKQPTGQEETDWKNCPQCKKITYLPDLIANSYICGCSFHHSCYYFLVFKKGNKSLAIISDMCFIFYSYSKVSLNLYPQHLDFVL